MTLGHPFLMGLPDDGTRPWRVITDGSQSSGIGFGDACIPPGAPGPGRHVHTHEDEGIYVISGILTVEVGDQRYEAGPESLVWLPRGVPHIFANLGEEEGLCCIGRSGGMAERSPAGELDGQGQLIERRR